MTENTTHQPVSIGYKIGRLSRSAHVYFKHRFGELGLGHAQGLTLHHICRQDGIDQLALLNKVRLDKSSLTSQLKKLEEHGYIVRKPDPADRRAKRIFITDKTRALQDDLHDIFASWTGILTKGLDDTERETLIRLLDTLQANASDTLKEMRAHEETE
jgi:DNA-binding MarR family transcriptional regulator